MSTPKKSQKKESKNLTAIYDCLLNHFGPQHWWPGETDFEVCIGAVLTQNTSWLNVEKAIDNLKKASLLDFEKIHVMPEKKLAKFIKPSGYYNLKAKRLKALLDFFASLDGGDWRTSLQKTKLPKIRETLLNVYGIGPETADSILLYGAGRLTFVIDKYTLRFSERYGIFPVKTGYEPARAHFMDNLPGSVKLYNEYHALLVAHGKYHCKPKPACSECPLRKNCGYAA
ncbi:MAG: endonuclease III [bacterium]|nr:MAG: endonuclease III [bacterium]